MALPPEPLAEVLAKATLVVEAEVVEIIGEGPAIVHPSRPPDHVGGDLKERKQRARLRVLRVMFGTPGDEELIVTKPLAPYLLATDVRGPFLLRGENDHVLVLGRYGPDTYPLEIIEKALSDGAV